MGTDELEPLFPNAAFVFQRREVDTFASVHPMQWAWYVPGGMEGVRADSLVLVDGDVELGPGVALLATPGHTDGNQSLCLNTPGGVWVTSENGVAADNWQPHLSRIPGVREWAETYGREIVMNANTLEDSIDQYDSMLKEKAVADAHREDPRWANVLPSSELVRRRISWPVAPTFFYGGMNYGAVTKGR
jgi:glyoxylase-like metal-dependent hydrolase (beta-lactamase superfamily II)